MDGYVRRLLERDDVTSEETIHRIGSKAELNRTRERAAALDGAVVVAVTNDDGQVLLVENDWMDGYGFPGGGVEPGEDPEAAAIREVREETGVTVEIERPWRVHHGFIEYDGDRFEDGYAVFYQATPIGSRTVADDPGVGDETIEAVGWFDDVPERAIQPDLIRAILDEM